MADKSSDDRWLVLTVKAPSDAQNEALAEGLLALGGTAVLESEQGMTTYVRAPADPAVWLENAAASLREHTGLSSLKIDWGYQDREDWTQLWKRGLEPRRVGRSIVVAPSWSEPETRPDDLTIVVDPEMAFGTGEHATTRGALRFLEQVVRAGDFVMDIGTGSAILAIAAARLGAARVVAIDNDADAIVNARDNLARNEVAAAVRLEQRTVDAEYLAEFDPQKIDVIVANVLSSVLVPLLPALWYAARENGHVILGGILEEEADDVLDACATAGFEVLAEDLEEEWWGVLLRRPQAAS